MFLTTDELHRLTGYRRHCKQIEWLRARRIKHWVNASGHPVVTRAAVGAHDAAIIEAPVRPNLAALRRA